MSYKRMKVFDCQDMPAKVSALLFDVSNQGNDSYVSREVFTKTFMDEADDGTETEVVSEEYSIIDEWLLENGALPGEYVLIKHWW